MRASSSIGLRGRERAVARDHARRGPGLSLRSDETRTGLRTKVSTPTATPLDVETVIVGAGIGRKYGLHSAGTFEYARYSKALLNPSTGANA
jgi:hypothetical protein